jgi:hypothetical protein
MPIVYTNFNQRRRIAMNFIALQEKMKKVNEINAEIIGLILEEVDARIEAAIASKIKIQSAEKANETKPAKKEVEKSASKTAKAPSSIPSPTSSVEELRMRCHEMGLKLVKKDRNKVIEILASFGLSNLPSAKDEQLSTLLSELEKANG